jgi:hypothetical protein
MFQGLPILLTPDEQFAIVAYTYDLGTGKQGNLYFECNIMLRERSLQHRVLLMQTWGLYVHYFMQGMKKLPAFRGTVFRGYPNKAEVVQEYRLGRPVQWGAFTSTTTDFEGAKGFTDMASGAIFEITVLDGRDIQAYSFFPRENEILLSPSHRFIVTSEPRVRDGFTVISLVQQEGNAFVS